MIGVGIALTFTVRCLLITLLRTGKGIGAAEAFGLCSALLF